MAISKTEARRMVREAELAAVQAAGTATPNPMLVYEAEGLTDRPKPDARAWYVAEGACGFAWVNVSPANSRIANRIKEYGSFSYHKSYYGGTDVWMHMGGQSIARKESAARAYAAVITRYVEAHGENARVYAQSRLD
jgi:hypothetical protein